MEMDRSASASCGPGATIGSIPARRNTWTRALQIEGSSSTMSTRGLPGTMAELSIVRVIRVESDSGCRKCFSRWRHSGGEPGDELFRPDAVAGPAGRNPDAPLHGFGECIGIGKPHVTSDGFERVGGLAQKGIRTEQPGAGHQLTGRYESGTIEAAIERTTRYAAAIGYVGNAAECRRIANQPFQRPRQRRRGAAEGPLQARQEAFGEHEARLTLQHATELLRVVIEPVEYELFQAVAAQFDERSERLGGEDRIHDHRKRAVPVVDGANAVSPRFSGRIELGIDDQNVNGLPADNGVGVGPIECRMHAMPVAGRTFEAGELGRLDAGGDVHSGCLATLSRWGQND